MRARVWLTAIAATLLVTTAGVVSASKPLAPTGLEFLKPYVVKTETEYQRITYRRSPGPAEYRKYQTLTLHGIDRYRAMKKVCTHFPETKGWRYDGCSLTSSAFRDLPPPPAPQNGLIAIMVYEDSEGAYVETFENLSLAQVALIRLQNAGRDPFEKYGA